MAVSRGGVAFWVGCICSYSRKQRVQKLSWSLSKVVNWQWTGQMHPLSSATWALAPPNSLRYQNIKQPVLFYPLHHANRPQRQDCYEDCEESISVCVLVQQGQSKGFHTLLEIPMFGPNKLGELLAPGTRKSSEFSFPLTMVDGSREDDISIEDLKRKSINTVNGEHSCFRSLFETEGCPAPFMYGSRFYCFHCPDAHLIPGSALKSCQDGGLDRKPVEVPLLPSVSLCSQADRAEREHTEGESEGEEKLALMYERLRIQLPNFFMTNHDYTMYSNDVEFINGIINVKISGRILYQLTLSLWRLLCLCYYAEARLDVLKLTKHMEDGTIKARWRIKGLPFYSLLLRFYRKDKSHLYRTFDALSTFYIGRDGLIHCHKVEKVMPAQPPVLPRVTSLLAGALVALGVEDHRPVLNLLPLLLSSLRQSRS
ncbi:uncharacterized protein C6orf136 homolog [Acanthochromis polyacanthus]|uniref:uncharacterized protein C6orf136 homolog n=1 Tax=Acanthochromis polyacanthus TaxID=80966 RepID=UPI002233FFC9|nr:uncharacterized protein C6orf136 homolog [Acanthochromis polyacanthus]XP_022076068.2 uncharacterized protein C6orf136 homolog [Acanthochromis polyacanthus]